MQGLTLQAIPHPFMPVSSHASALRGRAEMQGLPLQGAPQIRASEHLLPEHYAPLPSGPCGPHKASLLSCQPSTSRAAHAPARNTRLAYYGSGARGPCSVRVRRRVICRGTLTRQHYGP